MAQQYHLILNSPEIISWAKNALKKSNRIVWYLQQVKSSPSIHPSEELKHYYSMKIPKIELFDLQGEDLFEVLNQFAEYQKEYLSSVKESLVEVSSGDEVILELPDNYYWVNLHKAYCPDEAKAMGHCGNESGEKPQTILSLRRKVIKAGENFWEPHLTFILKDGSLGEMKGKQNDRPSSKYHTQILELIRHPMVSKILGGGYKPENNFHISQFPEKEYLQFLKTYPQKFSYNVLEVIENKNILEYFQSLDSIDELTAIDMLSWIESEKILSELVIRSRSEAVGKMALIRFTSVENLLKVAKEAPEDNLKTFASLSLRIDSIEDLRVLYSIADERDIHQIKVFVREQVFSDSILNEEFLVKELNKENKSFGMIKHFLRNLSGSEEKILKFPQKIEELTEGKPRLMKSLIPLLSAGQLVRMILNDPEKYKSAVKYVRNPVGILRLLNENSTSYIERELIGLFNWNKGIIEIIHWDNPRREYLGKDFISEHRLRMVKQILNHPKLINKLGKDRCYLIRHKISKMYEPSSRRRGYYHLTSNSLE